MASPTTTQSQLTLEEFLRLPNIDEHPYLEYLDGKVVAKVSPQKNHSVLTRFFLDRLNQFAEPKGWGEAFPELRCSYSGRSIVPDVVFLIEDHIDIQPDGMLVDVTPFPPDIHIEIISPEQTTKDAHDKLLHSTAHGCALGWLVHPYRRMIDEYRPGQDPLRMPSDGALEGEPILPGFRLPVADVFGWLTRRKGRGNPPGGSA